MQTAAANGLAVGGGLEVALTCDLIVAADHARFGLPEPRVGLMAAGGGVHRLPRQIPLKAALGLLLTGRQITVQEAYRPGMVNEVVPLAELMELAERWARKIVECEPLAVQATKLSVIKGLGWPPRIAWPGSIPPAAGDELCGLGRRAPRLCREAQS